jgi:lysophospholipase L1-like esterase
MNLLVQFVSFRRFSMVLVALMFTGCAATSVTSRKPHQPGPVRVACVGDSITFGAGVQGRETNSYPAALGRMLGPKFEVRNFGRSGATLLKRGDLPYWTTREFADATSFAPDVVILKLGTNDSKPPNWAHRDEFATDARALIEYFRALPSRPWVYVCLPVPVYQDKWGINEATVAGQIIPELLRVAQEARVPVIDLHSALGQRSNVFPDGVHPNAVGASYLAQAVYYAIAEH